MNIKCQIYACVYHWRSTYGSRYAACNLETCFLMNMSTSKNRFPFYVEDIEVYRYKCIKSMGMDDTFLRIRLIIYVICA